ncbi:hypothetical protein GWI33_001915 [Rhynchophorus ferrugineus]|uniref:RRM domain-containing protein n=1 Tax=Rhynchophorus ferrugineus TaxID=354439 RepID=A0A834MLJ1_RHYFE|nr:hypothetical protein GWI33_001915 [Rhynchophorus ferrugineus]
MNDENVDNISAEKKVDVSPEDVDLTCSTSVKNKSDDLNNQQTHEATSNNSEVKQNEQDQQYDPKNVHYEGDIAIYTDSETGHQYQWDKEKNEWITRNTVAYDVEDDTHIYTDSDGVKYFWDKEKNAWFPKVDDDFIARYQMNYGFNNETKVEPLEPKPNTTCSIGDKASKVKGEKRKASEPTWFELDESQNTNVYVSNLPLDIEEQEFIDLMQKCGLVMRDPVSGKFKIKLYKEPNTDYLKGDGLCTYIKVESVALALNLLDGYNYKGRKLKVERAKFQLRGEYDPKLKPKMKKKKDKLKLKKQQEKLFDWRPEKKISDRAKHEKVVIIKNLFDPKIFDTDVSLILEFQQDLREEAGKIGEVRKTVERVDTEGIFPEFISLP